MIRHVLYRLVIQLQSGVSWIYHTEFEGAALYTLTFIMAMNRDVYNSLPGDLKAVIDENSGLEHSNRCLVWMIYLNDDYEGGETEYLYYKKRIKPEKGKLLIWPAGMTHCHRGGLVLSGTKYIATGWFYLANYNG